MIVELITSPLFCGRSLYEIVNNHCEKEKRETEEEKQLLGEGEQQLIPNDLFPFYLIDTIHYYHNHSNSK